MICVPVWARAVCWSSAGDPEVRTEMTAAVEAGRIRSPETFHDQYVCFVRLTTTLGQVGWGQTSTYNADITARIFHRQVAPWAIGAETSDIGGLITTIEEREHKYPGSYRCRALAGLDTALWDLHGRATGRPTARPARVRPSWWTPTAASLRAGRSRSAGSGGAEQRVVHFEEPAAARGSMLRTRFVIRRLSDDDENRRPFGKSVNLHGTKLRDVCCLACCGASAPQRY